MLAVYRRQKAGMLIEALANDSRAIVSIVTPYGAVSYAKVMGVALYADRPITKLAARNRAFKKIVLVAYCLMEYQGVFSAVPGLSSFDSLLWESKEFVLGNPKTETYRLFTRLKRHLIKKYLSAETRA